MGKIVLEEKYILEYIRDMLNDCKLGNIDVIDAKYHHNTSYIDAPSICQHGILTISDLRKMQIKEYSDEMFSKLGDIDSHVNGDEAVSLSVQGLTDLYPNEDEYKSSNPLYVDFLVSDSVKAGRSTTHYGNEYLCRSSISNNMIKSVDIRLLELLEKNTKDVSLEKIITKYNSLKSIAVAIKDNNLNIPMRELSFDNSELDIDKLCDNKTLVKK